MKDVNKVILIGRLGVDPIQRQTKGGAGVANFTLATSRKIPKTDLGVGQATEYQEETQWHKIVVWGRQSEVCSQYLKKGDTVYLEGNIRSHSYEDKAGATKTAYEIHADEVNFLSSLRRPQKSNSQASGSAGAMEIQSNEWSVS